MHKNIVYIKNKLCELISLYMSNEMTLYSSNAGFFLIISSIPLFMILFSAISLIPYVTVEDFIDKLNLLFPNIPYIRSILFQIMSIAHGLATKNIISINAIIALVSGSTSLYTFSIGIRKIHKINTHMNYFVLRFFAVINMFFFLVAIFALFTFFLLGLLILGYVNKYLPIASSFINSFLSYKYLATSIILIILLMSLYSTSTNFERKFKHNIIGASISTFIWILISRIFSIYFLTFPLNASVYGSLASIVLLLLWLYICMNLIFLGAAINEVIFPHNKI